MLATPMAISPPVVAYPANCLSHGKGADGGKEFVDFLLAEAKVWPLRALEPGDELLPESMPDRFIPQMVVMDVTLDPHGRVSDCRVRQRSTYEMLNLASCQLARRHYLAAQSVQSKKPKVAVIWSSRTAEPELKACGSDGGTVPVASSLWINKSVLKGVKPQNGAALMSLDVGANGVPTRCTIIASNVSEELQRNVCRMAVQQAAIMPASDQDGNLVPARLTRVIRFTR